MQKHSGETVSEDNLHASDTSCFNGNQNWFRYLDLGVLVDCLDMHAFHLPELKRIL